MLDVGVEMVIQMREVRKDAGARQPGQDIALELLEGMVAWDMDAGFDAGAANTQVVHLVHCMLAAVRDTDLEVLAGSQTVDGGCMAADRTVVEQTVAEQTRSVVVDANQRRIPSGHEYRLDHTVLVADVDHRRSLGQVG